MSQESRLAWHEVRSESSVICGVARSTIFATSCVQSSSSFGFLH